MRSFYSKHNKTALGQMFGQEITADLVRQYLVVRIMIGNGSPDVINEAVNEAIALSHGLACVRAS